MHKTEYNVYIVDKLGFFVVFFFAFLYNKFVDSRTECTRQSG